MDKYEYKVRSEEIKSLIAEGAYAEAAEIADTIDWRRVKSVMMLCTVSDLYKVNRRYEDAKNMLLLAYEKKPGGRTICYSLCELCIKTEEFVQAVNYYNEFMRVAPKDPERYILQYKLYEAQNVNLEERIGVLEELKKRDYREKWAYELAYLYHRVGLATRCVEECDELILWFGEGKYVIKAMELKMLHQPLTYSQQEAYDHRFDAYAEEESGQYIEGAEEQDYDGQEAYAGQEQEQPPYEAYENGDQEAAWEEQTGEAQPEELDIQVKTMDVGKYNTINLQEELAAGLQEVLGADGVGSYGQDANEESAEYLPEDDEMEGTEVFFGETGEIEDTGLDAAAEAGFEDAGQDAGKRETDFSETETVVEQASAGAGKSAAEQSAGPVEAQRAAEDTSAVVMNQMREERAGEQAQPPKELADVLLQETDGQIKMVLPERTAVERQITGQMNIEDILAEWERMKKENEEKCREEVRQHVLRQTGPMFTEFEAAVRDGILAQLEDAPQKSLSAAGAKGAAGTAGTTVGVKAAKKLAQPGIGAAIAGAAKEADVPGYGEAAVDSSRQEYAQEAEYAERPTGQDSMNYPEEPEYTEPESSLEQENPEYGEAPEWNDGQYSQEDMEEPGYAEGEAAAEYGEVAEWTDGQNGMEYPEENGYAEENLQDGFGYEETPEWADGLNPGVEYEEAPEWEDGRNDSSVEYEETPEWTDRQNPDVEYEEAPEWEDGQDNPDAAYEDTPEWADGQTAPEQEYAERHEWSVDENEPDYNETDYIEEAGYGEAGEIPEETEWSQGGVDYMEAPEYAEEAEIRKAPDETAGYAEDAEFMEDEGKETDAGEGLIYTEEPESPTLMEEEDDKSEALDYLEALEHVEEEEILEEQEDDEDEDDVALDSDGFEMIGPQEEESEEESRADKEKKTAASKEDGGRQKDKKSVLEREKAKVRSLTREEKELFAPFIQNRQSREQLVKAIDGISMAAYTGNVVITGEEGMDTLTLAKNMIREVRMTDSNFSGKVAKITGAGLNRKSVRETLEGLHNGALIIQKASGMDGNTAGMLHIALQQEKFGIIVFMEDTRKAIQKLFLGTPQLFGDFTARVDLEALSNDTLVSFGRRYAREKEYSIDDLGMLALHTRIEESQTIDHVVTVIEVKQIVDEAIRHANRKTIGHFFDILLARRYDDEDMIILTEKDFVA